MRLLAWLSIAAILGGCGQPRGAPDVASLLPGLELHPMGEGQAAASPFRVDRFGFSSQTHDWPYGTGFAVSDSVSGNVLWLYLHNGDYPPHDLHWADFDVDGEPDVFFHAGFEDVFETHIYLNRIASEEFVVSNFSAGYINREVYAVVLDLDGDEHPELLLPEPQGMDVQALDYCGFYDVSEELREEMADEYRRLAGRFESFNFRYGVDHYAVFSLWVPEEIRVFRLHGDKRWVTADFPEHLRWRIDMLRRMKAELPPVCDPKIDSTITYLQDYLEDGNG